MILIISYLDQLLNSLLLFLDLIFPELFKLPVCDTFLLQGGLLRLGSLIMSKAVSVCLLEGLLLKFLLVIIFPHSPSLFPFELIIQEPLYYRDLLCLDLSHVLLYLKSLNTL